jgi:uncharacterized protein YegP (UPF0339 family)
MHVELWRVTSYAPGNDEWYLRLVGSNGETMMHSEGYASHSNAKRAYLDLIENLDLSAEDLPLRDMHNIG